MIIISALSSTAVQYFDYIQDYVYHFLNNGNELRDSGVYQLVETGLKTYEY